MEYTIENNFVSYRNIKNIPYQTLVYLVGLYVIQNFSSLEYSKYSTDLKLYLGIMTLTIKLQIFVIFD